MNDYDVNLPQDSKKNSSFPMKLLAMLDEAEVKGWTHVVSWEMDGTAFRVHKPDEFVSSVMPQYFNQTKYKSFQRQLNLYGFARVTRGPDKGCYIHEDFSRNDRAQCQEITRKKVSDDEGVDLTPPWLPASLAVEPDPIDETGKTSSSGAGRSMMMDAFESYFQSNVAGSTNTQDDLKKGSMVKAAAAPGNALQRMLDSYLDPDKKAVPEQEPDEEQDQDGNGRKKYQRAAVFPDKLHDMLDHVEREGLEHIASWEMDGRAFKVHKINSFMKEVMPLFFKQSKYESLQRQLNLYGFTRVPKGPMKGCYHHPLFLKGGRSLSSGMARRRHDDDIAPTPSSTVPTTSHSKVAKKEARKNQETAVTNPQVIPDSSASNNITVTIDDDDSLWEPTPMPTSSGGEVAPIANSANDTFFSSFGDTSPVSKPPAASASAFEHDYFKSIKNKSNGDNTVFASMPWAQNVAAASSPALTGGGCNSNDMFASMPWAQPNPVITTAHQGASSNRNQFPFAFVPQATGFSNF